MSCIIPMRHSNLTKQFVMPLWQEKSLEVIDHYFSDTADVRTTFIEGMGPSVLKQSVHDTFLAFPRLQIAIDEVLQQGNKVIYRWQAAAKHEGSILEIPATGKNVQFSGVVYGEIEEDLITRYHSFSNIPQVLKKLKEETAHTQRRMNCAAYTNTHIAAFDPYVVIRRATDFVLSKREIECLSLWLQGYSLKETAKYLGGISFRTVQTFRDNIKLKLRLTTPSELVAYFSERGIISLLLRKGAFLNK